MLDYVQFFLLLQSMQNVFMALNSITVLQYFLPRIPQNVV